MDDFERDIFCLAGLPFDAVDMAAAVGRVRAAAESGCPCFLSTPNLNFLIGCGRDAAFRDSVIHSDLCVADGMPLVWMARLLGIRNLERVAGSGLFEALWRGETGEGSDVVMPVGPAPERLSRGVGIQDEKSTGFPPLCPSGYARREGETPAAADQAGAEPLPVYFFGGPPGVAERACHVLNSRPSGLNCAGFASPGFGSIEAMSGEETIAAINASGADFLVVALGARKGQAWIEHNRQRITVPVISHLGAVVNFVAGTVSRAPVWMQRTGMEWLWRIKEEPALWQRYWKDGTALIGLLLTRVLPYALWLRFGGGRAAGSGCSVRLTPSDDESRTAIIIVEGSVPVELPHFVRSAFREAAAQGGDVRIDFGRAEKLSPAFFGLLLVLKKHMDAKGKSLRIDKVNRPLRRLFFWSGVEYLLD